MIERKTFPTKMIASQSHVTLIIITIHQHTPCTWFMLVSNEQNKVLFHFKRAHSSETKLISVPLRLPAGRRSKRPTIPDFEFVQSEGQRAPISSRTVEFRLETLPSLDTRRSISGAQISALVTGRKFSRIWQICKGGTLCKKQSGPVTILKSGDEISGIVTGSKLAARRPLKGGI